MHKTYLNWSSGKDSAMALYYLQKSQEFQVEKLLTTISLEEQRVGMHGLRKELLSNQIKSIGLPNKVIELQSSLDHSKYNELMLETNLSLLDEGITHAAFGDIFLEDLRKYREQELEKVNMKVIFPLWKKDTKALMKDLFSLGFRTIVVAATDKYFDQDFVGKELNMDVINNLPEGVDPCGENGEFHTFCFDGPIFESRIEFEIGEKVHKTYPNPNRNKDSKSEIGYWFCDLIAK